MRKLISLSLVFMLLLALAAPAGATGQISIGGLDNDIWFTKYGNVNTSCTAEYFTQTLGIAWGDTVTVSFLDQTLVLPVVPDYSAVDSGAPAIIVRAGSTGAPDGYVSLAINMGNFAETYGLAKKVTDADGVWRWEAAPGVTFPVSVSFSLQEQGGYMAQYLLRSLERTNNREDYAHLDSKAFANFREISTTGMAKGILFRTSSPINPELGRNIYADAAISEAGVKTIVNLADNREEAESYESFASTYYAQQNVVYLDLGVDFSSEDFKMGLAKGLVHIADNEGPYAIHCTEGKDRAGFVAALLECFAGATYEEVIADYMVTYINYYGVELGTDKYDAIAESNIIRSLKKAFEVEDLQNADLAAEAEEYIRSLGLTDSQVSRLRSHLTGTHPVNYPALIVIGVVFVAALVVAVWLLRRKSKK